MFSIHFINLTKKQRVGLKWVEIRYFEVDKVYKGLRVLGAVDVPEESTDDNPPGGGYAQHPLSADHDGWRWHVRKKNDIQMELNADNSVLRAVDFKAKAVLAGGDITALMSFCFPRGGQDDLLRGSTVIPGFQPLMADQHDTRHQELLQFFHYKNKFRAPSAIPVVHFSFKFDTVNDAKPEDEVFGATITLIEKWQISRLDVADYLACADRTAWAPLSFDPPSFEVANAAHNMQIGAVSGRAAVGGLSVQKERTHLVIDNNRTVVAVRPTRISGYFFQEFELQNYPFDSQILEVQLKSLRLPKATCTYVKSQESGKSSAEPLIRHTEWLYRDDNSYSSFEADQKLSDFDVDRTRLFGYV